jgi:hypothetical protein
MTEEQKDVVLLELVSLIDETEKIARKYMLACVHKTVDRFSLDHTRIMIDKMKQSLGNAIQ